MTENGQYCAVRCSILQLGGDEESEVLVKKNHAPIEFLPPSLKSDKIPVSTMRFLNFSKAFQARDFLLISNFFSGLGPGGFIRGQFRLPWHLSCIPGSSHGGIAQAQNGKKPYSGPAYDQNDTVSLLGGSGGEINYLSLAWIKVNGSFVALIKVLLSARME